MDALAEEDIMSSKFTYVIVKLCGLTMAVGDREKLTVGHDDKMTVMANSIARTDVARLCVEALSRTNLRFDVCSGLVRPHQITAKCSTKRDPTETRALQLQTRPSSKPAFL